MSLISPDFCPQTSKGAYTPGWESPLEGSAVHNFRVFWVVFYRDYIVDFLSVFEKQTLKTYGLD